MQFVYEILACLKHQSDIVDLIAIEHKHDENHHNLQ